MKKLKVQNKLVRYGKKIKRGWSKLAKKNGINISINGLDYSSVFKFEYKNKKRNLHLFYSRNVKFRF